MTTPQQEPDDHEPGMTSASPGLTGTIALIILAILCAVAAWIFVVFGAWPGAILILAAALFGILAKRRSRQIDQHQ